MHKWFTSYLSNRKQFVNVNGKKSDFCQIDTGVPQGSVLGPLLFLLYVNDIGNCVKNIGNCKLMLFADDTNVFLIGSNMRQLMLQAENILLQLITWFNANKLTLNVEKNNYSIFHSHKKKIPPECNQLTINDVIIDRVSSVKYLGVQIDDKLTWNEHVKQVSQTLVKYASLFKII